MNINVMLIVFFVMMLGMMFFSTRKQKKAQQEMVKQREALKAGDKVMTHSGLLGTVASIDTDLGEVVIESEGHRSKWMIAAIKPTPEVILTQADDDSPEEVEGSDDDAQDSEDDGNEVEYEVEYEAIDESSGVSTDENAQVSEVNQANGTEAGKNSGEKKAAPKKAAPKKTTPKSAQGKSGTKKTGGKK
jgi:preprotein translocase subunit YajC